MTAPKKPQDHQKPKPTVKKIDGGVEVTIRGLAITIETAAVNDYELLELAASNDMSAIPKVLEMLLGTEQRDKVKELLRDPATGRVPMQGDRSITEFIADLFEAVNPNS